MDRTAHHQLLLLSAGLAAGALLTLAVQKLAQPAKPQALTEDIRDGIEDCIGNTPLIRIKSLSEATGCEILGKAEVRNCNYSPVLTS